jgi:hypothetical protein
VFIDPPNYISENCRRKHFSKIGFYPSTMYGYT